MGGDCRQKHKAVKMQNEAELVLKRCLSLKILVTSGNQGIQITQPSPSCPPPHQTKSMLEASCLGFKGRAEDLNAWPIEAVVTPVVSLLPLSDEAMKLH